MDWIDGTTLQGCAAWCAGCGVKDIDDRGRRPYCGSMRAIFT